MRKGMSILWSVLVLCGLAVSSAPAEERVENPEYRHWAQFKPGSFSVLKTVMTTDGKKTEITVTTTLKKVHIGKVVLEMTRVSKAGGKEHKTPPTTRQIPSKISKEKAKELTDPEGKVKDGTEELEVAGKRIATEWVEVKREKGGTTFTTRTWKSDEVPGRVVKTVTSVRGKVESTTESIVIKFEARK